MSLPLYFAPLQGYTDAPYRRAHASLFGGVAGYYTPFVRIEKGDFRRKDLRDVAPENNMGVPLIPQAIASTPDELRRIVDKLLSLGYSRVDINLGCPFPVLAYRHKGAGLLPYPDEVEQLLRVTQEYGEVTFSVKMRLGWDNPDEAQHLLPLLHDLPIRQIVLHPRLGRQQYKGEVDQEAFARFYKACRLPLIYNGDLLTVADLQAVERDYPRLAGIMVGRGLLATPWLGESYASGGTVASDVYARVAQLHERLFAHYQDTLEGGVHQLLAHMATFWEYLLPDADKRSRKRIAKARTVADYSEAVRSLFSGLK